MTRFQNDESLLAENGNYYAALNACSAGDLPALAQALGTRRPSRAFSGDDNHYFLEMAMRSKSLACVEALIEAGIDVNRSGDRPPLIAAVHQGLSDIARALLKAGADPEAEGAFPRPLMVACVWSNPAIALALLSFGADPNAIMPPGVEDKKTGRAALHFAAKHGSVEHGLALLNAGADPFLKDANGDTPLDLARQRAAREDGDLNATFGAFAAWVEARALEASTPALLAGSRAPTPSL